MKGSQQNQITSTYLNDLCFPYYGMLAALLVLFLFFYDLIMDLGGAQADDCEISQSLR